MGRQHPFPPHISFPPRVLYALQRARGWFLLLPECGHLLVLQTAVLVGMRGIQLESNACSTNNKKPESDIGVQPEGQKSKTVLTSTSVQNDDLAFMNLRMRLSVRAVSSHFIILSSSGIKGVHHWN